jgi:hypothetical protein
MNPNSTHQLWSQWTFTVDTRRTPTLALVRENCARFGRKTFGSASQMRITQVGATWRIEVRTEGVPVHDPAFVATMHAQWARFLVAGFGPDARIAADARLLAGSRQDGRPADQLIIVPPIPFDPVGAVL